MKKLLKCAYDPYLSLLSYCTTPRPWCSVSPADSLWHATNVGETTPHWPYLKHFCTQDHEFKRKQKWDFDKHHRTWVLLSILSNTDVWIMTDPKPTTGKVVARANTPRSYTIDTPSGQIRHNPSQLKVAPDVTPTTSTTSPASQGRSAVMPRSRTGTLLHCQKDCNELSKKRRCDVIC